MVMGSLENYKLVYISEVHSISIERFKNSNTYTVYDLVFEQEIDSFTNYFDKFNLFAAFVILFSRATSTKTFNKLESISLFLIS